MAFKKSFKLRGNSPKIDKLRQEITSVINKGGDNSERIFSLESQIQLLVYEDLTQLLRTGRTSEFMEMKGLVYPS